MPTNSYQYIYQDSYGFLWLASYDGLFRWDGYDFKKYHHDESNKQSIDNNIVYTIFEDSKKRLWVGTIEGLNLYDRTRDGFIKCRLKGDERTPVNVIREDKLHQLWLGTSEGLCRWDAERGKAVWYSQNSEDDLIFSMVIDGANDIWCGVFNGGLKKFSQSNKTFTLFQHDPKNPSSLPSNEIKSLLIDNENRLWVGSEDQGLLMMNTRGQILHHYKTYSTQKSLKKIIDCIYQDKKGTIWVGVGREPLLYLDKARNELMPVDNKALNNHRDQLASIASICEDRFGNIWFASNGYGLFYTNEAKNIFKNYFENEPALKWLNSTTVTSFCQDKMGKVWIGTSGRGLLQFDPKNGQLSPVDIPVLNELAINDVQIDGEGNIWMATWGNGVKVFNPTTKLLQSFVHNEEDGNSIITNDVKAILIDGDLVWIGMHGEGLAVYDKTKKSFTHYRNNRSFPFKLNDPAWINHLFKDSKQRIWVSTYSGVFILDEKKLVHFEHNTNTLSISSNSVNMVTEDGAGNIWVVSELGLDKYNEGSRSFTRFDKKSRLPEAIKSAVVDKANRFWISSNQGIAYFEPQSGKLKFYDRADGLHETSYYQKAVFKTSDERLFFGGPKGFDSFHPDSLNTLSIPSYLYFTDLHIYNELQKPLAKGSPLTRALTFSDTLTLTRDQSFFSIGVTAVNLYAPSKIRYSYLLKGLQDEWIDISDDRKISFTQLPHGNYDLLVRCTDAGGAWQKETKTLHIIVLPGWWQTWWFKLLVAVLSITAIITVFYLRVASIKQRNRLLKEEVAKRTFELSEMNTSLVEQNDEIKQQKEKLEVSNTEIVRQSDKILEQQQLILNQNEVLEKTVAELEKLNQSKDQFFSILAHDLKNPVSSLADILSFMKHNVSKMDTSVLQDYLNSMHNSSQAVYDLLMNLLNWSRTQSGKIAYSPSDFDVKELVDRNVRLLHTQFESKNIQLGIKSDSSSWVNADYNMIDVIIRNILSNSIKFTDYNGKVSVDIFEDAQQITVGISDTGSGMSEEQIKNLFTIERGEVAIDTVKQKGTGLGLLIAREFITINKGKIWVESKLKEGTSFYFSLPKSTSVEKPVKKASITEIPADIGIWDKMPMDKLLHIKGKKILIVDDNKEVRDYLKMILSKTFEIFEAENGTEALEIVQVIHPSVIITDLLMPGINGLQFCKEIKANNLTSHIPVIILTGQWEEEIQFSGYQAGADAYLTKPVKKEVLIQIISNLILNQERLHNKLIERIVTDQPIQLENVDANQIDDEFINKLVSIIEAHISDTNLDAKLICKEMAVSRTVLYSKIKSLTGQTVHEFIKAIRLRKSLKFLLEGKLTISQVAFEVGFNSHSYFDKCFVKQYGMGPKEYVQKKKGGNNITIPRES